MVRTRTTILQAHTHQFLGTFGGSGNGDYRGELKRAAPDDHQLCDDAQVAPSQILVRLDGLYGDAAVLTRSVRTADLGIIGRSRDYLFWTGRGPGRSSAALPAQVLPIPKAERHLPLRLPRHSPSRQGDRTCD